MSYRNSAANLRLVTEELGEEPTRIDIVPLEEEGFPEPEEFIEGNTIQEKTFHAGYTMEDLASLSFFIQHLLQTAAKVRNVLDGEEKRKGENDLKHKMIYLRGRYRDMWSSIGPKIGVMVRRVLENR